MIEIVPNWHPIFVHFTVALLSLAVVLFVIAPFIKQPLQEQWQIVARWSLWFGALLTVITGLTGLLAYNSVAHDTLSHAAMTDHRNWAIATMVLFLSIAVWSFIRVRRQQVLGTVFILLMVISGGLLGSTAWRGGEIVYRYGLGVMSLPKTDGEGHDHDHADASGHGHDNETTMERSVAKVVKEHHENDGHHDDIASIKNAVIDDQKTMKTNTVPKQDNHHDDGHNHKH